MESNILELEAFINVYYYQLLKKANGRMCDLKGGWVIAIALLHSIDESSCEMADFIEPELSINV